jgi:hypothetical protein
MSAQVSFVMADVALTCAIAKYSIRTDVKLRPNTTQMAISVDTPSMKATVSGPTSLQNRSIRRICELSAENF